MHTLLFVYLAGVVVGLWRVDASPAGKAMLALGWPAAVAAAAVVLLLMSGAALVLFPTVAAVAAVVALVSWILW